MVERRFALVVENEIIDILESDESYPYHERWTEGFSKNPIGFDATGYEGVEIGSVWNGNSFTPPTEIQP